MLSVSIRKRIFRFNFPAGTSRGVLREKISWFLCVYEESNPRVYGLGECGPLAGLSPDPVGDIGFELKAISDQLRNLTMPKDPRSVLKIAGSVAPSRFPSIRFAMETALLDLFHGGKRMIMVNDFYRGKQEIPINGLVWMNDGPTMINQAKKKVQEGFKCIKIKIGAIDFEEELRVLQFLRDQYGKDLIIRVDANGAFSPKEAMIKLEKLAEFNIHSIEQPIPAGMWKNMAQICRESPVPIALDEELIGKHDQKLALLEEIRPQYIVLKPTLLGGLMETEEWIQQADNQKIGWWITSMLESNIGLNAISQYAAQKAPDRIHGLGTGQLYENNVVSPLEIRNGHILYLKDRNWDLDDLG